MRGARGASYPRAASSAARRPGPRIDGLSHLGAADGVTEFLLVLGQARIEGTVQMVINPVAIL